MGFETILFASLIGLSAASNIRAASSQAEDVLDNAENRAAALKKEGDLATKERSKALTLKIARQTSSFLNSGISLEGTPTAVLDETFETGFADIKNIGSNFQTSINNTISSAKKQSKSIIAAGRAEAINSIVSGFSSFALGASGASPTPPTDDLLAAPIGSAPGFSTTRTGA